jgi:hypothetical protein
MNRFKSMFAAALVAATTAVVPAASAAVKVHVVAAGSSALFQATCLAAFNDLAVPLGNAGYFTKKSTATLHDTRPAAIPDELGNLWVVWGGNDGSGNPTDVWLDLSVDSTVGNRAFFAVDAAKNKGVQILLNSITTSTAPDTGVISTALFTGGVSPSNLPTAVFNALTTGGPGAGPVRVTAGFTDIRPEDATFATRRANTTLNTITYGGLGYGTSATTAVGTQIKSALSASAATPVAFALTGTDPISKKTVRPFTTIPIGASPIVFVTNRSNASGLGQGVAAKAPIYKNVTDFYVKSVSKTGVSTYTFPLVQLFGGYSACNGNSVAFTQADNKTPVNGGTFAVTVFVREPLSGTYNTVEFDTMRIFGGQKTPTTAGSPSKFTQEHSVNPALGLGAAGSSNDPMYLNCPTAGARLRGIGTGEVTNGGNSGTSPFGIAGGVLNTADSIGYAFFSFGNVSKLAGLGANAGYLTLDGVDPIFASYAGGDPGQPATSGGVPGQLPVCNVTNNGHVGGCTVGDVWNTSPHGPSFPNLRNGTYRAWSLLRVVAEPTDTDTPALISKAQDEVDTKLADFVPFATTTAGDPGLTVYREHFLLAGVKVTPSNGAVSGDTLGGGTEAGGDVGGLIQGPFSSAPPTPGPICNNAAASATVDVPFCYTHGQQ